MEVTNAVDCTFHLPGLCDCSEDQSMVQEELLEMPPDPPKPPDWKPASTADEERERFGKLLGEFLEEDDTPTTPPKVPATVAPSGSPAPVAQGSQDIAALVNSALDAREKDKGRESRLDALTKEVEALKAPRKRKWWEPWTMFSDAS